MKLRLSPAEITRLRSNVMGVLFNAKAWLFLRCVSWPQSISTGIERIADFQWTTFSRMGMNCVIRLAAALLSVLRLVA